MNHKLNNRRIFGSLQPLFLFFRELCYFLTKNIFEYPKIFVVYCRNLKYDEIHILKERRAENMTIEEKLRDCILMNYRSMRDFTLKADIPYSTLDTILKRGIMNASIGNILKICSALNISADELANGNIVPVENKSEKIDVEKMLIDYKLNDRIVLELDGLELSDDELLLLSDSMEVSIGIIKRRRESSKRMSAYVEGLSKAFKNIQDKKEGEEE